MIQIIIKSIEFFLNLGLFISLSKNSRVSSIKSLPNQANWSSLLIVAAQTETNKNTVKDDDIHEAFENIVDEVVSTFNPAMEVLESSSNSIVLDNVAHPEFLDFLK